MKALLNTEFLFEVQGARSAESEIVRGCTTSMLAPRNATIQQKNEFIKPFI